MHVCELEGKKMYEKILLGEYAKEKWQKCSSHVKKIQEECLQQDGILDEVVNSLIVHLGESSD
jgi:hypothetical protein